MDEKTESVLEEAEELVRRYKLHIKEWGELLRRTHVIARRIEERVQRVLEVPASTEANPVSHSERPKHPIV
jgi:hypothetical protein